MRSLSPIISACRYCQHYASEGRRGGQCKRLGAPVQGCWKACSLAIPPFAPSWEVTEGINVWQQPEILEDELITVCFAMEMSSTASLETVELLEPLTSSC